MKQNYQKPFSTVVQMTTENIIAASALFVVGTSLFGPEKIDDADIIGDSIGEAW